MTIKYKYTIAMVNLNMEDTIQQSILSIYNQLDENFEILVVDGGSTDKSIQKLKSLQFFIKNLRIIELKRDKTRLLGADRNTSIINSKGEYVLLHLDCDDVYAPFIKSWIKIYHILENIYGDDNLIMGKHINMAKRKTLIDNPYKNAQMEDRELWIRMLSKNKLIEIDHIDIAYRIKKTKRRLYFEIIDRTIKFCVEDLNNYPFGIYSYFTNKIFGKNHFGIKLRILNIFVLPIVILIYFSSKNRKSIIDKKQYIETMNKWKKFRQNKTTVKDLLDAKKIHLEFQNFSQLEKKIFKIT